MRLEERNSISFGASAAPDITPTHNLGGWKIKLLGKAYRESPFPSSLPSQGLTWGASRRTCRQEARIGSPRNVSSEFFFVAYLSWLAS